MPGLWNWVAHQRYLYALGKLSDNQINELRNNGFLFLTSLVEYFNPKYKHERLRLIDILKNYEDKK